MLPSSAAPGPTRRLVVLLVDDGVELLDAFAELLRFTGLEVMTAPSGLHALQILEREHERIDLLVTDLMMPGMNGQKLLCVARRKWPEIGRVMLTAWPTADLVVNPSVGRLLAKDFHDSLLLDAIVEEARRARKRRAGA